jgi:hypothetical protein
MCSRGAGTDALGETDWNTAAAWALAGCGFHGACSTVATPAPPITRPAVTAAAALSASPVPTAAPPPPKKEPSEPGMGTSASDLSAPRWARWRRANDAQSRHSRKWARS